MMASILSFGERMARAKAQKRARFAALSRSGNSTVRQFAPEHSPEPDSDSSAVSLSDYFSSSEESGDSDDCDYDAPRSKRSDLACTAEPCSEEQLRSPSYFVSCSSSVMDLVDKFNSSSRCKTDGCNGVLIPTKVQRVGLGGALQC